MSTPASQLPARDATAEQTPLRFVTAASLFDGHDAAINIMRRLIQAQGVEVVHLGHNRSVEDVVRAALQEDADAIALSSYQGGHVEYFKYMVDMLRERNASHIKVFGGGGGTITPEEIKELHDYGVERIYHPNDGMHMGLVAMIEDVVRRARKAREEGNGGQSTFSPDTAAKGEGAAGKRYSDPHFQPHIEDEIAIAGVLSAIEEGAFDDTQLAHLRKQWQLAGSKTPVIGLTGTGGAGKSSVTDELLNRFLQHFPEMRIAVLAVDPTRRRTGGALLGDRIRMNSLRSERVFMRSMATRRQHAATSVVLKDCIGFLRGMGYDLVIVETAGIGQSDSEIVDLVDFPMYVMTSDYGAASQLEKIDMVDFAELIVLNKYDKRGAEDALRDVRKQWKRNRIAFQMKDADVPVYPTIASQFNDPGITWMFVNLCRLLREKLGVVDGAASAGAENGNGEWGIGNGVEAGPGESGTAGIDVGGGQAASKGAEGAVGGGTTTAGAGGDEGAATGAMPRSMEAPADGALGRTGAAGTMAADDAGADAGAGAGTRARGIGSPRCDFDPDVEITLKEPRATVLIPGQRVRYLAEIAEQGRGINSSIEQMAESASKAQSCYDALQELGDPALPKALEPYPDEALIARMAGSYSASPSAEDSDKRHGDPKASMARNTPDSTVGARHAGDGREAAADSPKPHGDPDAGLVPPHAEEGRDGAATHSAADDRGPSIDRSLLTLRQRYNAALSDLTPEAVKLLRTWPARKDAVTAEFTEYHVRDKAIRVDNYRESLSHQKVPKIAPPQHRDWGDLLKFLMKENLPGGYPYTGGVYPYRRTGEDPIRMFAGEGTPERTNRRFHYLSHGLPAARLSTAFDSVTLYGEDPAKRPDIYGKIGNSGVNVPTLDDMKKLYSGFDLCAPTTSVSMTINGPAPMILAMFMNTAIDQQVEKYLRADSKRWDAAHDKLEKIFESGARKGSSRPQYKGMLPEGHDGLGLGLLGVTGDEVVDRETYERIKAETLKTVRGTVQADILKEDQAQNTCIFSTEFALRMMGDIQQYFVDQKVRNFYSVSISGYHIAEAGANPISQLAFTLSNGFTIVEYYLARGMDIDDFAPNLSFFFSNGMDPEYTVIGRVARRIWARAMRERYGASARSQMMKYHIQTSGRSLHAQEIQFNDIRTTLQALYALFDNCNSLHTNAYDEAITTPTEESVRRAVAIQMIINKEMGLNFNENPWQGSFIVDQLTDIVEEAVYKEFEAISERGGVLGAMDTMYQRGKIQEESMYYEARKHDGSLPLIGVNTFLPKEHAGDIVTEIELIRSTPEEKGQQIDNVARFQHLRNPLVSLPCARSAEGRAGEGSAGAAGGDARDLAAGSLTHLQQTARNRHNVFTALMEAVKYNSLGQISHALYEVGGEYRRNM